MEDIPLREWVLPPLYHHHTLDATITRSETTLPLTTLIAARNMVARLLRRLTQLVAALTTLSAVSSCTHSPAQSQFVHHSHQASDTPHVPHTSSRIPPRLWYVRSTTTISLCPHPRTQVTHVEAELVPFLAVLAVNHGDAGARVGRDLGDVGCVVDVRAGRGGHEEREGEREDECELHRVVVVVDVVSK
jgi:hypothetical protein